VCRNVNFERSANYIINLFGFVIRQEAKWLKLIDNSCQIRITYRYSFVRRKDIRMIVHNARK